MASGSEVLGVGSVAVVEPVRAYHSCWANQTLRSGLEGNMSESYCAIVTTTDSADEAAELARGIVAARLAACVQIMAPIRSFYWWEGKIEDAQEWQCWAKTDSDRVNKLTDYIKAHHSYEVPEIIVMPITGGSADYLAWLTAETRPTS